MKEKYNCGKSATTVYSETISDILKSTPLKTRLYILNEMMIQSYLVEIGHIPDGFWSNGKERKYGRSFRRFANQLTKLQIKKIKEWEKDGRPM
jgi:hypothetical protein